MTSFANPAADAQVGAAAYIASLLQMLGDRDPLRRDAYAVAHLFRVDLDAAARRWPLLRCRLHPSCLWPLPPPLNTR